MKEQKFEGKMKTKEMKRNKVKEDVISGKRKQGRK